MPNDISTMDKVWTNHYCPRCHGRVYVFKENSTKDAVDEDPVLKCSACGRTYPIPPEDLPRIRKINFTLKRYF